MKNKNKIHFFLLIALLLSFHFSPAQLTAPGASGMTTTEYRTFPETDNIFIFCVESEGIQNGELNVHTTLQGTKTFLWEKYNSASVDFEFYHSESLDGLESSIKSLSDGGYRVTINQGETTEVFRAWIFNSWISATAEISDSNCESFRLTGDFNASEMIYYDPESNEEIEVFRDLKVEWKDKEATVASVIDPQIFSPPTANTEYNFRIYDRFGCAASATVLYESIVTKAKFSLDPMQGEAPLTVNFRNESENGSPNMYVWFFYKNLDDLKKEGEKTQQAIDSIDFVAYDDSPVWTFEKSGSYKVKLVSKKESEFSVCVDTAYMDDFITIDTSFIAAPNVFTPNGDGVNDLFVVKFWSMKNLKISIYNRWGKRIHFWESSDVRGFGNTYTATVWDGRLGGRYASPGVYYYVAEGKGRDDKNRRARGFFHLFRDKE